MVAALDTVTVDEMQKREFFIFYYYFIHEFKVISRFSRHSQQLTDAYNCGLTGSEAAWANKTYYGNHTLPTTLMDNMEKANLQVIRKIQN